MLREDGCSNKMFLTFLFSDQAIGIEFPKDMGLLRSKVECNTCGRVRGPHNQTFLEDLGGDVEGRLVDICGKVQGTRRAVLRLLANTDWSQCPLPTPSDDAFVVHAAPRHLVQARTP
jgi:hypothetical protein